MKNIVRQNEDFGKDYGLIHEVIVAGRKVGAGQEFWTKLAHDKELFEKVVVFCQNGKGISKLVDNNGRIIPIGIKSAVCEPDLNFKFIQPEIDYAKRLNRAIRFFPGEIKFPSLEEFQDRSEYLIRQLQQDDLLSNLLKGVFLPFCFPRFKIGDYGEDLEKVFLKATGDSYEDQFPERKFYNYRKGDLKGKAGVVEKSRHNRFLERMAEGPGTGIMFFPFQGDSINAVREIMPLLPKSLLLAGAVDIALVEAFFPDVLAKDFNTLGLDCAGVFWRSSDSSLFFGAHGGRLWFDYTDFLGDAYDDCSAGLVFLG